MFTLSGHNVDSGYVVIIMSYESVAREYLYYTRFARIVALISCEHRCENHCSSVVGVLTKKDFNERHRTLIGLGTCTPFAFIIREVVLFPL